MHLVGCAVSAFVSDLFANPLMQIGVILFCTAWFVFGLRADLLTAALSILAITLTQMVLNRQNQREEDAHRRDVALHAKLDELIIAKRGARDAMAGIEELAEHEIVALRENHEEQAAELSEVLTRRVDDRDSGNFDSEGSATGRVPTDTNGAVSVERSDRGGRLLTALSRKLSVRYRPFAA